MENKSTDAVSVAPHVHKILIENEKVRVLEVTVGPGEKADMHTHPANVIVALSDGQLKFRFPDGSEREVKFKKNTAMFSNPVEHAAENNSTQEVRFIVVELK